MRSLRLIWAFIRRDAKIAMSYRLQFIFQAAAVLSVCVTFFFLSLMLADFEGGIESLSKYGGSYFAFAVIGLSVSSYVDFSLRTFSTAIRTAQITGTFEAMLTTRTRIGTIIGGSSLYTLGFATFRAALMIFFGATLFGIDLHFETWPVLLLVVGLTMLATLGLGIFSAGFIVLFHKGDPVTSAISGLTWLLSGVIYPKEILPPWVQDIADFLPLTHALEALRLGLLRGAGWPELQDSILALALFAVLALPLSLYWFSWAVGRAKLAGALARY